MEVMDGTERVFKEQIEGGLSLGCAVVVGPPWEERPDEFVVVYAEGAEHRGGAVYMVDLWVRVVVPVDVPGAVAVAKSRRKMICDFLDDPGCVLRKFEDDEMKIFGYQTASQGEEREGRQVALPVVLRVGAAAFV